MDFLTTFKEIGQVTLTSLLSIVVIFLLTKLDGVRQVSQLSMFDYVNGITIGSIAAELATDIEDYHKSLTALIIYGLFSLLCALASNKSIRLRRLLDGNSKLLYDNGKLYNKNLSKTHLDVDEFLTLCRNQGYFDLQDIQTAILEPNGNLSILPKSTVRPTSPEDFNLNPTQDHPLANVIIDGKIIPNNLKATGKNERWLMRKLHDNGISDIKQVMLATCSIEDELHFYIKHNEPMERDIFE